MNPIRIRPLKYEDYEQFVNVIKEGYSDKSSNSYKDIINNITVDKLHSDAQTCNMLFGFFEKDEPVGVLELGLDENYDSCINIIAVIPEYRKKGYGFALLDYAVFKVEESAMTILTAKVDNDDNYAIDWFKKYGFIYDGKGKLIFDTRNRKHCCHR
ncbi:MAG: GNAT family N-acetyltransferase [Eubacterium sp.]